MNTTELIAALCSMSVSGEEGMKIIAAVRAAMAKTSGEGLQVWNGRDGRLMTTPTTGAVLSVQFAMHDRSYELWFASREAAVAALAGFAAQHERLMDVWDEPNHAGRIAYVDLTAPGCHSSYASVYVHVQTRG